jgi:hypothetical protein
VAGPTELVEIQTAGFASASRKLERLLTSHRVVLVHPIPIERWLVRVDADGAVLGRRRFPSAASPSTCSMSSSTSGVVAHPGFRIELPLTREEEIRGRSPKAGGTAIHAAGGAWTAGCSTSSRRCTSIRQPICYACSPSALPSRSPR